MCDHWHSQDFPTGGGGQSEGAKRPSGQRVCRGGMPPFHGREIENSCIKMASSFLHIKCNF